MPQVDPRIIVVGLALILTTRTSLGQQESTSRAVIETVLNTDAAYRNATLKADVRVLNALLSDDIVIVHSDGETDNKKNFLNAISSGRLRMQSYERTKVDVRIYGSTALLISQTRKTFKYRGTPGKDNDTSISTYVKSGSQWQMVAMQNTHRSK